MSVRIWKSVLAVMLGLGLAAPLAAQTGSIAGKVTDAESKAPLPGSMIQVFTGTAVVARATSGSDGAYRIASIAPGTYLVLISSIGYAPARMPGVSVTAGSPTTVDANLAPQAAQLNEVVVTASRAPEKVIDAPASVGVVSAVEVAERPALSVTDHLRGLPGVDISQGGLLQSNVVARGFNNAFSGALLTLTDNRFASVPSLRVNVPAFFPTTNEDIDHIEFVLGPGAALYGPNSANGVLNIITKSPFNSTGTILSLEGGYRGGSFAGGQTFPFTSTGKADDASGLLHASFRHAGTIGDKLAYKISGDYVSGTDWRYVDPGEPTSLIDANNNCVLGQASTCKHICAVDTCRDYNLKKWGGEARLDYRPNENTEAILSYGRTTANNLIELTGIGASQARDWTYQTLQGRFHHKRLFLQAFGNFSDAGETFLLRSGNPITDRSRLFAAQFQHGFDLGKNESILYGADYIFTNPITEGSINGRNENDDQIKEIGGYVHSLTRLSPNWEVLGAIRVDKNNRLDKAVFSPRAALVFKPDENQNVRFTYNRAFETPDNTDLFLDLVAGHAGPYTVRALGVPHTGFQFRGSGDGITDPGCPAGGVDNLCMRSPFAPQLGLLPANAAILWQVAVGAVARGLPPPLATALAAIPAPTNQVGTQLRRLNPTSGKFEDILGTDVRDINALKPTITNSLELGYKAIFGGKARLSIDLWYERKDNFIGPLLVETPNVFLDRASTIAYLSNFLPASIAGAVGTAMAGLPGSTSAATTGVPLGTVVPHNSTLTNASDIVLTYRNFGQVDLFGTDFALDYIINNHFSVAGTVSLVNKDFFPASVVALNSGSSGGVSDIALNAAKGKGTLTGRYRDDPNGWSFELRFRAVRGFPINSGVYATDLNADGSRQSTPDYGVFDANFSWRLPFGDRRLMLGLSGTNLLNHAYQTFVGVPMLGRFITTRLQYAF